MSKKGLLLLVVVTWCLVQTFVQAAVPPTPIIKSPANDVDIMGSVLFEWYIVVGASGYNLQVAEDEEFTMLIADIRVSNVSTTWYIPNAHSTYFWRVRSSGGSWGSYIYSPWSDTRWFYSLAPDSAVTLEAPANGVTINDNKLTFWWQDIPFNFDFQIAGDDLFTDLRVSETNLDSILYTWFDLPQDGSKLYWRVRAHSYSSDFYPWSEHRWFISAEPPRSTLTVQVSPKGGGEVTVSPASTDRHYAYDTVVTLTAIANSGYEFTRWDGGGTSSVLEINMTRDRTLVAVFTSTGDDASCGGCGAGKSLRGWLGDWLLVGLALLVMAGFRRR